MFSLFDPMGSCGSGHGADMLSRDDVCGFHRYFLLVRGNVN